MMTESTPLSIRDTVREKYAASARLVATRTPASCCGTGESDPITSNLYSLDELAVLPEEAQLASLGCGNPTALATLEPGQVVLDLGSGGGIDVLLSEIGRAHV